MSNLHRARDAVQDRTRASRQMLVSLAARRVAPTLVSRRAAFPQATPQKQRISRLGLRRDNCEWRAAIRQVPVTYSSDRGPSANDAFLFRGRLAQEAAETRAASCRRARKPLTRVTHRVRVRASKLCDEKVLVLRCLARRDHTGEARRMPALGCVRLALTNESG